jgi:hypothetical protein
VIFIFNILPFTKTDRDKLNDPIAKRLNIYLGLFTDFSFDHILLFFSWIFSLFTFQMFSPFQVSPSETPYLILTPPPPRLYEDAPLSTHSNPPVLSFTYTGSLKILRPKALSSH